MADEFDELYNMLSTDREDVKTIKSNYEKDLSMLLGRIYSYPVDSINIQEEYDLENDFEKYKMNNIFLNYTLHDDALDYKISLLQNYLQELFVQKKFNQFIKEKEESLSKGEYLEYVHNSTVRSEKVSAWYQEFMQK